MSSRNANIEDVANFVLFHCMKNRISINHFKLQKILYYIQAWHLVYFENNPLFNEQPEAWVNGPVYRSIYKYFKDLNASDDICLNDEKLYEDIDNLYSNALKKLNLTKQQQIFLFALFDHYILMPYEKLILMTHMEKPWNDARRGCEPFDYCENKISYESMKNYYSSLI